MPRKSGELARDTKNANNRTILNRAWTHKDFHEGYIKSWVNRQGTFVPEMSVKTERVRYPDGYKDWEEEYYIKLPEMRKKLRELELRPEPLKEHLIKELQNQIEELKARIKEIDDGAVKYRSWEDVQLHRCFHGWRHMTGIHYFYFNFGWIEEVDEDGNGIGAIQPDYRQVDNMMTRRVLEAKARRDGDLWAKRRRLGATWMGAGISLYEMVFLNGKVFFLTFSRDDQEKFFQRVIYMHDRLPYFLRKPIKNNNQTKIRFGPSDRICEFLGNDPDMVPDAELSSGSTTNEKSVVGGTSSIVIVDEIGEIENLSVLLSWAESRLNGRDGFTRAGILLLFGTIGSMDKAGPVVKRLVDHPEIHQHGKCLLKGTYGVRMDEYGNDLEDAVFQMIIKRRAELEAALAYEELVSYKQRYPVEWADCWVFSTIDKLMPVRQIGIARDMMAESEWNKLRMFGLFYRDQSGEVLFKREEPAPAKKKGAFHEDMIGYGQWMIWEPPQESILVTPYAAGCDPVDMQRNSSNNPRQKTRTGIELSDITAAIYKRDDVTVGSTGNFWVAEYQGRPFPLEEAFEQILLGVEYYGTQVNVERQKGSALFAYAEATGRGHLLYQGAGFAMRLHDNAALPGYDASAKWWEAMLSRVRQWWIQNYMKPVSQRMMYESENVREQNTDQFVSNAAAYQMAIELDLREQNGQKREKDVVSSAAEQHAMKWGRNATGKYVNPAYLSGNQANLSYQAARQLTKQAKRRGAISRKLRR